MKQIVIQRTGEPASVAQLSDAPAPPLPPGHVRLRMKLAPVNPADLNYIEGTYGKKPVLPAVPGIEGVGEITELAADVCGLTCGSLAIPLRGMGCWAEEVVRPAADLFVLPEGTDPAQAAMLRVNPATAWGLLHASGPLPRGAWVAQNAASSNCGHCVIQIARHLGLRTLNLVRRTESAAACETLGAEAVLVDHAEAVAAARALPDFAPPALALNAVGGDSALRLMDLLAPGGTMVTYGAMARQPVKVPNGFLIFKDVRLRGYWLSRWLETAPADEVRGVYARLAALVAAGALRQRVAAEYPLTEISAALRHAAAEARGGKVLLRLS
jgi:mitochondrial enoyl-[acyl-carrier protein] reductase / trans-2-enoyl-CoA reductase